MGTMTITKVPLNPGTRTTGLGALAQLNSATQNEDGSEPDALAETETGVTAVGNDHVHMLLQNNQNYGYIGTFYLGSQSDEEGDQGELQPIRILLDTGSANSWIMSKEAVAEGSESKTYDPAKSTGGT